MGARNFRGLGTAFLLAVAALAAAPARADDVDTLFNRYLARFRADTRALSEAEARNLMATLRADGTWPDIDLSVTDQVNWTPRTHLDRIAQLSKAYATAGHALAGNAETAAKASLALDAWIRVNPKSTNWWFNEIGGLLSLGPCAYFMKDRLTASQHAGTDSLLARAWKSKQRTGENLVWISRITLWRAVLNRDEALLSQAAAAIAGTIAVSTAEGIQADFSFHQHGAQFYNGGYGLGFAADGASVAADLGGTRFAFAPAQTAVLAGYLLDGQRWMIRGSTFDHSARGREITRPGGGSAASMAEAAANLAPLAPGSAKDLSAFAAAIKSQTGSPVQGNRWFWRSEYMAHHRASHFISLRMASKRLLASEVINQEGLLSQYLADGATLCYRTGKEYADIFPAWDWCGVPGTTVAHAAAPPAMKNPAPGAGDFAGGASEGGYGAAGFDYAKLGVKARKAWFFFDKEMVALGAGITAADSLKVRTTVNQCLLNGPVTAAQTPGGPMKTYAPGTPLDARPLWIHHDGIGYYFAPAALSAAQVPPASLATGKASGAWKTINAGQSATVVDKNVFNLWFEQGGIPNYQYTVLPDATPEQVAAYAADPAVQILQHSAAVLAVRHRTLAITQAVFFEPARLAVGALYTLAPDRACIVLVREETGRLILSASDPRFGSADLKIAVGAKLEGPGAAWSETEKTTMVTLALPKGDSAGATATRTFSAPSVALRHAGAAEGFALEDARADASGGSALSIAYRIPAAGEVSLSLLDARGRTVAGLFQGEMAAGRHRWKSAGTVKGGAAAMPLWIRLEWEGRRLIAPVRPAGD